MGGGRHRESVAELGVLPHHLLLASCGGPAVALCAWWQEAVGTRRGTGRLPLRLLCPKVLLFLTQLEEYFPGRGNTVQGGPNYLSLIICVSFEIKTLRGEAGIQNPTQASEEYLKYDKCAILRFHILSFMKVSEFQNCFGWIYLPTRNVPKLKFWKIV